MKIKKKCLNCGKFFEAQMITAKYCCHKCNAQHYKIRKKEEAKMENPNTKKKKEIPYDTQLKKVQIQDYLSIKDVTFMMGISRSSVYRLIKNGYLKSAQLGSRVLIRKKDLDQLIKNQVQEIQPKQIKLKPAHQNTNSYFYTKEIPDYYDISISTLDRYLTEHNVKKYRDGRETFILKKEIEKILGKPTKTPESNV